MSAIITDCGLYRYELRRVIQAAPLLEPAADGVLELRGKLIGFYGINPSTADAMRNDSTARKWIGFCSLWGARGFVVGNAFALRSRHVSVLSSPDMDVIGPENDQHLRRIADEVDVQVPCWGSSAKIPRALRPRLADVLAMLRRSEKPVMCFGTTSAGDPLHPLFLPYSTNLVPLP